MSLELEGTNQGLKLPRSYPSGWHDNTGRNLQLASSDDDTDSSSILNLTTSRLQKDVR